jgi:hypothetical protein
MKDKYEKGPYKIDDEAWFYAGNRISIIISPKHERNTSNFIHLYITKSRLKKILNLRDV